MVGGGPSESLYRVVTTFEILASSASVWASFGLNCASEKTAFASVARSRSEALAWCVRLVGEHSDEWLSGLREAMSEVERLRAEGPSV